MQLSLDDYIVEYYNITMLVCYKLALCNRTVQSLFVILIKNSCLSLKFKQL